MVPDVDAGDIYDHLAAPEERKEYKDLTLPWPRPSLNANASEG